MLRSLQISNYAIIDHLDLEPGLGLSVMTGETGAGKSIILGALSLIMGARADSKVLYDKEKKCIVEGTFDIKKKSLQSVLASMDLDFDDFLTIRREINTSGRSRTFVNDTPTTLQNLKTIMTSLVDLHKQFDTQDLKSSEAQTKMLDALAGIKSEVDEYGDEYSTYSQNKMEVARLISEQQRLYEEKDFIMFQLNELNDAQLIEGEEQNLEQMRIKLSKADEIKQSFGESSYTIMEGETNLIDQLGTILRNTQKFEDIDDIRQIVEELREALELIRSSASSLKAHSELLESNPTKLREIEDRLDTINKLLQKHRALDVLSLIQKKEVLDRRANEMQNMDREIDVLQEKLQKQSKGLKSLAAKISLSRSKAVPDITRNVTSLLKELGMPHAKFKIVLDQMQDLGPLGTDEINYLFSANAGVNPQPLDKIASGGETSRLALTMKYLSADKLQLPTMIFDEVDTGISGEVSRKMARILREMSKSHQIICITHSPQIASAAHQHFHIIKVVKENRTYTEINLLKKDDRIVEIAKILSGVPPTDAALANARELIMGN